MKKNLIALLLAALLLPALISCGEESGAQTPGKTSSDTTAAADTAAAETTTAAEYVDPGVKFDGKEFCIAAYDSDNYFWQAASYCDAYAEEENGDPINDSLVARNRAIEEGLNVSLTHYGVDVSSRDISAEVKKLILAGDDKVDLAYVTGSGVSSMVGTGDMLVDLNKIGTLDLSHSWWDATSVEQLRILGANYFVTGDASLYANFSPIVYFVNKQVVEDFSLDNPYDLVRKGTWTLDKMNAMCEAVARDVNGDNKMDINDAFGMGCETGSINMMLAGCGVRITTQDADGVPQLVYNTEKAATLVAKLVTIIRNHDVNTVATDYSGYGNAFTEVLVPMFADNRMLFFNNQLLVAMNLRDMQADFGILPPVKYDEAQEDYIDFTNGSWISFLMIPVTNLDLDMTGYVMDALGYYGQKFVTPAYIETTVLNKTMRDEDSAEMLELVLSSRSYDIANYYNWGSVYSLASTMCGNKTTDFASEYAKIAEKVQTAIDTTIATISGN